MTSWMGAMAAAIFSATGLGRAGRGLPGMVTWPAIQACFWQKEPQK